MASSAWDGGWDETNPIGIPAQNDKLTKVDILVSVLKAEIARLDQMSQNYSNDLTTIRMVTMNDIVRRLEEILYA